MRARDVNLFEDPRDELGLSQLAYRFCGGLLQHAKALAAVTNPLVNSYKRLIRGGPEFRRHLGARSTSPTVAPTARR